MKIRRKERKKTSTKVKCRFTVSFHCSKFRIQYSNDTGRANLERFDLRILGRLCGFGGSQLLLLLGLRVQNKKKKIGKKLGQKS